MSTALAGTDPLEGTVGGIEAKAGVSPEIYFILAVAAARFLRNRRRSIIPLRKRLV
jgi:hypothetical protein